MPSWSPDQYLRFAGERTRPCRDLAAAVAHAAPGRVIDLGCGPGNSTEVLAARWPGAAITGLDSSEAMLEEARRGAPERTFALGDIGAWSAEAPYDVVFSNAALQWVPDHDRVFPRLMAQVAPGGALAAQVPSNIGAPAHEAMRAVAGRPAFKGYFQGGVRTWHVHEAGWYYDLLSPLASRLDIWETEYLHVLDGADAVVSWYRGTGLRPYLDALPEEAARGRFLDAYREAVAEAYPARADGRVLLPFRRLFVVAYR